MILQEEVLTIESLVHGMERRLHPGDPLSFGGPRRFLNHSAQKFLAFGPVLLFIGRSVNADEPFSILHERKEGRALVCCESGFQARGIQKNESVVLGQATLAQAGGVVGGVEREGAGREGQFFKSSQAGRDGGLRGDTFVEEKNALLLPRSDRRAFGDSLVDEGKFILGGGKMLEKDLLLFNPSEGFPALRSSAFLIAPF